MKMMRNKKGRLFFLKKRKKIKIFWNSFLQKSKRIFLSLFYLIGSPLTGMGIMAALVYKSNFALFLKALIYFKEMTLLFSYAIGLPVILLLHFLWNTKLGYIFEEYGEKMALKLKGIRELTEKSRPQ